MDFATLFGYAGTVTGVSFMLLQVLKSLKTRSVEDISWLMLWLLWFNTVFWGLHGFFLGSTPLVVVNLIAIVIVSVQLELKRRYRNNP